jgi:hypothetical protein
MVLGTARQLATDADTGALAATGFVADEGAAAGRAAGARLQAKLANPNKTSAPRMPSA